MPRIRTIKPQFWLDEPLWKVSRDARLTYIGLWNLADDNGVFEYRPARIKNQLFPEDADITADDIQEWLNEIEGIGKFGRFTHNSKQFGYIFGFPEHQVVKNPSQWSFAPVPDKFDEKLEPPPAETEEEATAIEKRPKGEDEGFTAITNSIFKHWNEKDILTHRKMTDSIRQAVKSTLREYEGYEIMQAIDNYAFILRSSKYFFTYKWTLKEFIRKNMEKFLDLKVAKDNYRNKPTENHKPNKPDLDKYTKGHLGHMVRQ